MLFLSICWTVRSGYALYQTVVGNCLARLIAFSSGYVALAAVFAWVKSIHPRSSGFRP